MSAPVIIAFCAAGPVSHIEAACPSSAFLIYPPVDPAKIAGRALTLLAVGPEGGAALARWVAEHGLDGVRGIGLVGVTAPWVERRERSCESCMIDGAPCNTPSHWDDRRYRPLGPIEPLRSVAERARAALRCENWSQEEFASQTSENGTCSELATFLRIVPPGEARSGPDKSFCSKHAHRWKPRFLVPIERLSFIVACAPDDGVCPSPGCGGRGWHYGPGFSRPQCDRCAGSGKALSSAEVALELSGDRRLYEGIDDFEATTGGHTTIHYPSRAELDEHGLRAVVERLVR